MPCVRGVCNGKRALAAPESAPRPHRSHCLASLVSTVEQACIVRAYHSTARTQVWCDWRADTPKGLLRVEFPLCRSARINRAPARARACVHACAHVKSLSVLCDRSVALLEPAVSAPSPCRPPCESKLPRKLQPIPSDGRAHSASGCDMPRRHGYHGSPTHAGGPSLRTNRRWMVPHAVLHSVICAGGRLHKPIVPIVQHTSVSRAPPHPIAARPVPLRPSASALPTAACSAAVRLAYRSPAVGPSWPARPPWGRPGPSRRMYTHCCALHRHPRVGAPTHRQASRHRTAGWLDQNLRHALTTARLLLPERLPCGPLVATLRSDLCTHPCTCVRAMAWHLRARYGVHASMHTHNHARPQTYTPRYVRSVPWLSPPTGGYSSASAAV